MKKHTMMILLAGLVTAFSARAETVIEAVPDTLPGKSFGGVSGFMAGALAGPVGAVVGAGVGWLVGGGVQQASGFSGTAYRVARDDGSDTLVRSPNRKWSPGDRVRIVGNRLVGESEVTGSAQTLGYLDNH